MLQLKNVTKSYKTHDFEQVALNGVSLSFRKNEFVAILGPSGSGKTTCLNIIGGLDHYDSGDLIINNKSTKHFKDSEWDAYRNNSVGFIFQSYNLITHLSIIDNVEMGMTLSGVSNSVKHKKAMEVLEKVGLKDHVHKKPNQLSGGQMQRVAIARALANDPDIILADEPTGALDTTTSEQIMNLIQEIAKDKLVVMVTHNPEIAHKYADRIINFKDGVVTNDSNPYEEEEKDSGYQLKKTSMSFFTALKLSGRNISTKKWRTTLTAFASSIGIIGIAMILALSNGFQIQIDKFQRDALAEFPIIISPSAMNRDQDSKKDLNNEMMGKTGDYVDSDEVYLYDSTKKSYIHFNKITDEYIQYVEKIDPEILNSIGYTRITGMNLLRQVDGKVVPVKLPIGFNQVDNGQIQNQGPMTSMNDAGLASYPETLKDSEESYLEKNYDVLYGAYPTDETGIVLVVDNQNRIDYTYLENLGFKTEDIESIKFKDIVGTEIKLVSNDNYFVKSEIGNYVPSSDFEKVYNNSNNITLKITGVVRQKQDVKIGLLGTGLAYSDRLVQKVIDLNVNSTIVKAQRDADYNVITMEKIDPMTKNSILTYLGGETIPNMIFLYPTSFESKELVTDYLDQYNATKDTEDQIVYSDLAATMTEMTGGIMDAITLVLIAFAAISLVVSLIMIGIITYISVLERTKEIGVLRALGARKKDITRVFNAETFIIGTFSGILGITIAYLLTLPVNKVIENVTDLPHVAQLNPVHALLLVAISVTLTLIGGAIPARMASKKDPVEALRSE